MERLKVDLSGLTDTEQATLSAAGIRETTDLMVLEHTDIVNLLPNAGVLEQRKLTQLARYLAAGNQLISLRIMQDIMMNVSALVRNVTVPEKSSVRSSPDTSKGAPKISVNQLEKFSGSPIDFEDW